MSDPRVFIPVANSYLTLGGDTSYNLLAADLRTNMPSGLLTLGDGTFGGIPLNGINYGLPTDGLIQWVMPSGIEGDSLGAFMREFPRYTRVNWDKTSLGAQIFTAVSRLADELTQAQSMYLRSSYPISSPLYEQGVVYEWNFNDVHDLNTNPAISGRLGTSWFTIPLVKDEHSFWTSPPTRLETTTNEIDDLTILNWTQVGVSGLKVLLNSEVHLPLHNQIIIEVSGARSFQFDTDTTTIIGSIFLHGHWPHEGYRHQLTRIEEIAVQANVPIFTQHMYRSITRVETRGVDPSAYVRIRVFNFNTKWKSDSLIEVWPQERGGTQERVFWQLAGSGTSFSGIVQPDLQVKSGASTPSYLACTRVLSDSIFDNDLEWDVLETWKLSQPNGTALSGIVDIAPVPNSRFMFLLDRNSKVWVMDTYRPSINMKGFAETTASPVHIILSSPKDSSETVDKFTVRLDPTIISTADGVQRWRWAVHHHGTVDIIPATGNPYPFNHNSGWQTGNDETVKIPYASHIISGTGQYIFELAMMTDNGIRHQTYAGFQQVEKRALGSLSIGGLLYNPSGIEFDSYGRPWVAVSGNAVRLIMRTDTGIWIPDQQVLITRENYDEVRRFV